MGRAPTQCRQAGGGSVSTSGISTTEIVLLASMFEYPEAYHQAVSMGLRPEDFARSQDRLVFRTMLRLAETQQPITFESLICEVEKTPDADQLIAAVNDLTNPLHLPQRDIEWHVKKLQDARRRTRLNAFIERTRIVTADPTESTASCIENLEDGLLDLQAESTASTPERIRGFMPKVLRHLEERSSLRGLIGLPTSIKDLDDATTGIRPGELWVVGAMSGRGKTTLATQIALANVAAGNATVFFSLEMSCEELGERFFCNETSVSASRIRNPSYITSEQWREITAYADKLITYNLYIDDSSSLNIQALIARARLLICRFGCKLVIVDYLRLVSAPGRELREQVASVTDALRRLAKSEHVGVIALSQLARPKDRNTNSQPNMLGLKESGDIEAHAHVVLLIHMPLKKNQPSGEDQIIIGKNRHGPVGAIDVTFNRERFKFLPRVSESEDLPFEPQSTSVAEGNGSSAMQQGSRE